MLLVPCSLRRHSNLFFPLSASLSKLFVAFLIIISVTDRPTSSCFVARFQVISVAGRFAESYICHCNTFKLIINFKLFIIWHLVFARAKENYRRVYSRILAKVCPIAMATGLV